MFSRADAGGPDRERLDPPRWRLLIPRRAPLLRAAAVAALLCLAAGVLLLNDAPPPAPPSAPTAQAAVLPTGTVGFPLRLPDAGVVTVVRPGQRIDVLASAAGRPAQVLAADVLVLSAAAGEAADGALVYLAVTTDQAARLAALAAETRLSVTVRSP